MKIVFDGRVLVNITKNNPSRSGIFFSAYHLFLALQKTCDLYLYADIPSYYVLKKYFPQSKFASKLTKTQYFISYLYFLKQQRKQNLLTKISTLLLHVLKAPFPIKQDVIDEKNIFFSPFFAPPKRIAKNPQWIKFTLLHDCIPLILPDAFPKRHWLIRKLIGEDFFSELSKNLNQRDYYFANSSYTKEDFLKFFPQINAKHFFVTYLAADSKVFFRDFDHAKNQTLRKQYHIPQGVHYIFSLSNIDPRKNLSFVLENFIAFIRERRIDDLVFVLGGGYWGPYKAQLEAKISGFGDLKDKIIFTGYLDDGHLANLFSHSLCSVYLSLYEGFGLPALEAMQCGSPIIAAATTSLPEVVGDAGILVHPHDQKGLQDAYALLYDHQDVVEEYRQKGMLQAQKFSWASSAQIMMEHFKNALD